MIPKIYLLKNLMRRLIWLKMILIESGDDDPENSLLDWKQVPVNKKISAARLQFSETTGITVEIHESWK